MDLIEETYFGWRPLAHAADCATPAWDVAGIRYDKGIRTSPADTRPHDCTHPDCTHTSTFGRVQLRLLCRTCDTVHIVRGEGHSRTITTTPDLGWGQPPAEVGGVWLWPGQPAIPGGNPTSYLVTRDHADEITPDTVYAVITRYRDSEGTARWIAGATPDPDGAHHIGSLRFRHRSAGLYPLADAATWITTADTRPQRPIEVAV